MSTKAIKSICMKFKRLQTNWFGHPQIEYLKNDYLNDVFG